MLGRIDVEFISCQLVDFFAFDFHFAFQARRHFRQSRTVNFDACVLHDREHGDERQINFVIELEQAGLFHFAAQSGCQAAGDVGRLGESST